jgi:hypothetical protein
MTTIVIAGGHGQIALRLAALLGAGRSSCSTRRAGPALGAIS